VQTTQMTKNEKMRRPAR